MKKLILNWLFGTDDIKRYMELLEESFHHHEKYKELMEVNLKSLKEHRESLEDVLKLIKICENHGIDVDKEMKNIKI